MKTTTTICRDKEELTLIADAVAEAHSKLHEAKDAWEEARAMAIRTCRKEFCGEHVKIKIVKTDPYMVYDSGKLDRFFKENGVNPAKMKSYRAGSVSVLVSPK